MRNLAVQTKELIIDMIWFFGLILLTIFTCAMVLALFNNTTMLDDIVHTICWGL